MKESSLVLQYFMSFFNILVFKLRVHYVAFVCFIYDNTNGLPRATLVKSEAASNEKFWQPRSSSSTGILWIVLTASIESFREYSFSVNELKFLLKLLLKISQFYHVVCWLYLQLTKNWVMYQIVCTSLEGHLPFHCGKT